MSQSTDINNNSQKLHDSDRELSSEVTLESIQKTMTENFEKIFETLALLVHGQAMLFGNVLLLSQTDRSLQETATEINQESLNNKIQQQQHPVELPLSPALSSPNESSTTFTFSKPVIAENLTPGSSQSQCAECGMVFTRKSHDSISHHAKTTTCRPYQCSICKQLFKQGHHRNRHEKSHKRNKRKAEMSENNEEPEIKRIRQQDTLPLKDQVSKSNQIVCGKETSLKQQDHSKSASPKYLNSITFIDGSSSEDEN